MEKIKEEEINNLMIELKTKLKKEEIIAIIYNPEKEEGMKKADCSFLKALFDKKKNKNKYTSPIFILSGNGGDLAPGIYFPYIISESVKNYEVFIPRICGSALCYTLFKSKKLIVGKDTSITQIDPTFEYSGERRRAIKIIKEKNVDFQLKEYAQQVFNISSEWIKKLCEYPSLFRIENLTYMEFYQLDDLATKFMNKEEHFSEITVKELIGLGANIEEIKDNEINNIANEFIFKCQDFAIQKDVRVIFVTSKTLYIDEGNEEGIFICPIN